MQRQAALSADASADCRCDKQFRLQAAVCRTLYTCPSSASMEQPVIVPEKNVSSPSHLRTIH